MFDDLLDANRRSRLEFHDSGVRGTAARAMAVVTCIDSLAVLGSRAADAKIIRNGGRVDLGSFGLGEHGADGGGDRLGGRLGHSGEQVAYEARPAAQLGEVDDHRPRWRL